MKSHGDILWLHSLRWPARLRTKQEKLAQLLGGVKDIDGVPWMELEDAFTVELWDLMPTPD